MRANVTTLEGQTAFQLTTDAPASSEMPIARLRETGKNYSVADLIEYTGASVVFKISAYELIASTTGSNVAPREIRAMINQWNAEAKACSRGKQA